MTSPGPPVLAVEDLTIQFPTDHGWVTVTEDVTFDVSSGETLGLVGESGSGKSVTSLAILGLTRAQGGRVARGSVRLQGRELLTCGERELADVRGRQVGMVFQQALRSLDPAFTVGEQIAEVLRRHTGASRKDAWKRAVGLLDRVHIPGAERRARDYPHQFSGGMCQRVMIAMAMACEPELLIADEPTTALDVTVQAHILDLIRELQADTGVAVLFITHDLAVIAELCDRVAVMYAGQIVEVGDARDLFTAPHHPYTEGLLGAIPRRGQRDLVSIPGVVPSVHQLPAGCRFSPRCPHAVHDLCDAAPPPLAALGPGRASRCALASSLVLEGVTAR